MTALAPPRLDARGTLLLYRDDGPLARALSRLPAARALPAVVPVLLAGLPLLALVALDGAHAPRGALAAAVAWAVLAAGAGRACPHTDRLAWAAPPALRALEYGGILALAAQRPPSGAAGAFALLAAAAFRHYDLMYRLRQRGATPPAWVSTLSGGWDGRLIAVWVLMALDVLPAALYVVAGALAVVLVGDSVSGWLRFARSGRRAFDDEEADAG
jgi:hypothetical protein